MRIRKFVTTSLLAIAATSISATVAHADPAVPVQSGTEHGVGYTTTMTEDNQGVTTHLTNGRFDLTPDGNVISITADDGTLVERWPTAFQAPGYLIRVSADVSPDGSTMTVHPTERIVTPTDPAQPPLKDVGLIGGVAGVIVGAPIGVVLGCAVGLVFLIVGCIPGIFIGGVIGGAVGGLIGVVLI
ncbi:MULTISPECIES: hypothetical protein [unclassified Nocardia]|uniref:hypothetical protein n=1 Tax=unclassified Nocardia TaxID=2637762 RepID=UPI001CE43486|nr:MULTISPECIES: hypothetical protein [unclassified Nocardia]